MRTALGHMFGRRMELNQRFALIWTERGLDDIEANLVRGATRRIDGVGGASVSDKTILLDL
jgi:hypothetical protein